MKEKEYIQVETENKKEELDLVEEIDTEEEEIIIFFDNDDIEEEEEAEETYNAHDLTREIASYYRVALPLIFIMIFFTVILPLILTR